MKSILTKVSLLLTMFLFASFFSGCASITRGTKEALVIQSDPAGAKVTLSNGMVGYTPTAFKLKRKSNLGVTIEKEGYETVRTRVTHQTASGGAAGMAGNLVFGGFIGAGVDALSGATQELTPNPVSVKLVPVTNSYSHRHTDN